VRVLCGPTLVALLAACGETLGPAARPTLPGPLADSLATLTTLAGSPTFLSFRILGPLIAVPGTAPTAPIFPDSVRRHIYRWNDATKLYGTTAQDTLNGLTGVRFVLYTADTLTSLPAEPIQAMGQVDLLDASVPGTTRLRVVGGGSTDPTTVDYTLDGYLGADSVAATFDGCLSDATGRSLCVSGSAAQRIDNGDTVVTVSGTGTLASRDLTLQVGLRRGASQTVQTMDVTVVEPELSEQVRIVGSITLQGSTPSASIDLTVNGLPFATIRGQGTLRIRGPNGLPLTAAETTLIGQMFALPGLALDVVRDFVRPGQRVLGG
jgi:hypothetical protein